MLITGHGASMDQSVERIPSAFLKRWCRRLTSTFGIEKRRIDDLAGRQQPRPMQLALVVDFRNQLIADSTMRHFNLRISEV